MERMAKIKNIALCTAFLTDITKRAKVMLIKEKRQRKKEYKSIIPPTSFNLRQFL